MTASPSLTEQAALRTTEREVGRFGSGLCTSYVQKDQVRAELWRSPSRRPETGSLRGCRELEAFKWSPQDPRVTREGPGGRGGTGKAALHPPQPARPRLSASSTRLLEQYHPKLSAEAAPCSGRRRAEMPTGGRAQDGDPPETPSLPPPDLRSATYPQPRHLQREEDTCLCVGETKLGTARRLARIWGSTHSSGYDLNIPAVAMNRDAYKMVFFRIFGETGYHISAYRCTFIYINYSVALPMTCF